MSTCPRCAQPLTGHQTSTASLAGCLACGGIFLDRESRNRVVAAKCAETAAASDLAAAHARHAPDVRARCSCPVCRQPMHTLQVAGGVELDVCDAHGAWFDRHELRRFIDALSVQQSGQRSGASNRSSKKKRAAVAVAATGAVAATAVVAADDDKLETALEVADVGFSFLEVFGDLLGALAD